MDRLAAQLVVTAAEEAVARARAGIALDAREAVELLTSTRELKQWIAGLPATVDDPDRPACDGCGGPLTGRQEHYCSEACRSRTRRRDRAATA